MSDKNKSTLIKYALPIAVLVLGIIIGMIIMFYMMAVGIGYIVESFGGNIHIEINESAIVPYLNNTIKTWGDGYYGN